MKFVTYNLRCQAEVDGVNTFLNRKGLVMDKIEREQPDIIGFQEITPMMFDYLRSHLGRLGYTLEGCGRSADYTG